MVIPVSKDRKDQFQKACGWSLAQNGEAMGSGTLEEKTLHAVLKRFYELVSDIYGDTDRAVCRRYDRGRWVIQI